MFFFSALLVSEEAHAVNEEGGVKCLTPPPKTQICFKQRNTHMVEKRAFAPLHLKYSGQRMYKNVIFVSQEFFFFFFFLMVRIFNL